MPKKRLPQEVWNEVRSIVWKRDGGRCIRCNVKLELKECHIDHIMSGKNAPNSLKNLRTLCRMCHVLRDDKRHRGMISKALRDGIIPANWRELTWED
jgi:5-methylcytosine-specific restriction endonuclease McrA